MWDLQDYAFVETVVVPRLFMVEKEKEYDP